MLQLQGIVLSLGLKDLHFAILRCITNSNTPDNFFTAIVLTLFDTIQSFLANNYPKIDYPSSLCNQMGANWPRTHLKKGQKGKNVRKKVRKRKRKKKNKRKGTLFTNSPSEKFV